MIFVTLGTCPYPYPRLLDWIGMLVEQQFITERGGLFIQHGHTELPEAISKHDWIQTAFTVLPQDFQRLIVDADLIISHAGQGSTFKLSKSNVRFVIASRLVEYGEHVDDHQLLFAQTVEQFGVINCLTFEDLKKNVENPPPVFTGQLFPGPNLADYLAKVHGGMSRLPD